jgi:hypothetical protein
MCSGQAETRYHRRDPQETGTNRRTCAENLSTTHPARLSALEIGCLAHLQ